MRGQLIAVVVATALTLGGCLLHERPDDASIDAGTGGTVDAAETGTMPDAPTRPDANVAARDAGGLVIEPPSCHGYMTLGDDAVVMLTQHACDLGAPECQTIEVDGRDSLNDPAALCGGPTRDLGFSVRFVRCAPGSDTTTLRVRVLASASPPGGWYTWLPNGTCGGTTLAGDAGDVVTVDGAIQSDDGNDVLSFFGAGTRYAIEACAVGPCP